MNESFKKEENFWKSYKQPIKPDIYLPDCKKIVEEFSLNFVDFFKNKIFHAKEK